MIPVYKFHQQQRGSSDWDKKYAVEGADADSPVAYAAQPFVHTILRYLRVGQRMLDAGCGTGGLLRFLKQRGGDVTGIDSSSVAIATLKRLAPDIPAQVASIERLPFPDASFDAYLAIGSWEYPEGGPEPAAREAARVLKPGGLAFIEVPQLGPLRRLAYVPLKRVERWRHTSEVCRTHFGSVSARFSHHFFTTSEMRRLLAERGFEVLQVQPHDLPEPERHYGLWVDWPFLRARPAKPDLPRVASAEWGGRSGSEKHYVLNPFGRLIKTLGNTVSPWTIATGMFIVARKK